MTETTTVISIRNLVKTYVVGEVEVRALRGVSLDVRKGEFLSVTGPSGSGKSTLMHILGCLDRPTSGQYILDGQDVAKLSDGDVRLCLLPNLGEIIVEDTPIERGVICVGH